jgi:hypothetical protein
VLELRARVGVFFGLELLRESEAVRRSPCGSISRDHATQARVQSEPVPLDGDDVLIACESVSFKSRTVSRHATPCPIVSSLSGPSSSSRSANPIAPLLDPRPPQPRIVKLAPASVDVPQTLPDDVAFVDETGIGYEGEQFRTQTRTWTSYCLGVVDDSSRSSRGAGRIGGGGGGGGRTRWL